MRHGRARARSHDFFCARAPSQAHLKAVLKEYAELHHRGEHRGQYELKAEYRAGAGDDDDDGAVASG